MKYILLIILVLPGVAKAGWDGNQLKEFMDADNRVANGNIQPGDYAKQNQFGGFIIGVSNTLDGITICAPHKTQLGQSMEIVSKYVRDNPDKWNMPASVLVAKAMSAAFPCKR